MNKLIPFLTKEIEKLSSFFTCSIHLYRLYYRNIVKQEIALGNITNQDKILCIGGGAFPSTALEMAHQTGAKVWVVDCDSFAVKRARKVVKSLRMDNQITVLQGKGQEINPAEFTVVHMALQVFPRDTMLQHLLKRASYGTRILVRSPKEKLKRFYSCIPEDCCQQCQYICQKKSTMKATLLFTPQRGRESREKRTAFSRDFAPSRYSSVSG